MIPAINLWEIKSKIIKSLAEEFTDIEVGGRMLMVKPYDSVSDYKLCRVAVSWKPTQGLIMKADLDVTLYYDEGYEIEKDMGSVSTYLMYNIDEHGNVISEKTWQTDTWYFNIVKPVFREVIPHESEGILPSEYTINITPRVMT